MNVTNEQIFNKLGTIQAMIKRINGQVNTNKWKSVTALYLSILLAGSGAAYLILNIL